MSQSEEWEPLSVREARRTIADWERKGREQLVEIARCTSSGRTERGNKPETWKPPRIGYMWKRLKERARKGLKTA